MSPTLEIVRFRVLPREVDALLASREDTLAAAAVRALHPGMRSAHLAQVDEEHWIDVVLWESEEQALTAAAQVMSIPTFADWCRHIADVVSVEHAAVKSAVHV